MDESTEGVTLLSGFIFDVLAEYEPMAQLCAPAFDLAADLDREQPTARVPISIYNDICEWIEHNVGTASIRDAGRAIGGRIYEQMVTSGAIGEDASPIDVLKALKVAADLMIQDPKKRGWEILEAGSRRCRMRRTQTFNCTLQEGLLRSLVERTSVLSVDVEHLRCTRRVDRYCEYTVSWVPKNQGAGVE